MFVERTQEQVKVYYDKFIPGLGTVRACNGFVTHTHDIYRCEHCGYEAKCLVHNGLQFVGVATEPFYCRQCQHLIGIEGNDQSKI